MAVPIDEQKDVGEKPGKKENQDPNKPNPDSGKNSENKNQIQVVMKFRARPHDGEVEKDISTKDDSKTNDNIA